MIPNTKVRVFAFNRTTGAPVTGDAANITATWSKDYGAPEPLLDTNPAEIGGGYYLFDLSTSERTVSIEGFLRPVSSTSNVEVIPVVGLVNASRSIAADIDTGANNWDSAMNTWQEAQLSVITSSAFFVGVLADTNELQTDWANGGRLDLLLDAVKAKTDLIGVSSSFIPAPVVGQQLTRLIIGDDYLTANGRALTFTFSSSITPASTTLRFTKLIECGGTTETFNVTGSVSASGGVVTCVFQINAADWASVTAGSYQWLVEVVDNNGDVMTAINSLDQRVSFVEFQTVEGR